MNKKIKINWITVICALAVMAAAVAVRLPAVRLSGLSGEMRDAYLTEEGLPYLTDPDSYYHTRITDNRITYGSLSSSRTESGILWDTQSNYPEGRSADYQPGIVRVTEAVWKIARTLFRSDDLYAAEYWLPAIMAAFAALAAFLLGMRISGTAGGFTAGILVSCASAFVARALPGRFDTDMFTAVMDVLLILFLTEALHAGTIRRQLVMAAGFALTVVAYCWCWSVYAFMFSALTLAGGAVFLPAAAAASWKENRGKEDRNRISCGSEIRAWLFCAGITTLMILLVNGSSFFRQFIQRFQWAGTMKTSGTFPNLLSSVTELGRPAFLPSDPLEWFAAYIPGKTLTILNGIGGAAVMILCLGGIVMLILRTFSLSDGAEGKTAVENRKSLLYLCVLGVWLIGGLYASMQGVRFVEHLAVPAGILAGVCVGWAVPGKTSRRPVSEIGKGIVTMLVCAAAAVLPVTGAVQICAQNRPSVSDALADGMTWIKDSAEDPDAVIASWWDLGYFYEYASGHPAFWDGGSQSGMRAILIAKALTAHDRQLSARILKMMAAYGNEPVEKLITHFEEKKAFEILWKTLPMERQETAEYLHLQCGLQKEEAVKTAELLHPEEEKEIYLVISGDMLYKLGWIEYFAGWDFSGSQPAPRATAYSVMPDGSEDMNSENEKARTFFEDRAEETIWKLFFYADGDDSFEPVLEASDGISQIQVWRVEQNVE